MVTLPGFSSLLATWSHRASRVRGSTTPRHLQGQQSELRTPGATPQGETRGFGSPSDRQDFYDSLQQRRDGPLLQVPNQRTRPASGLGCARAGERLERSIIGRAKNVTLGKGGRRDVGKHVSLNPLPVPPVEPWISSSWRQTAATHAAPCRQYAHTHTHTPRRELHAADFCLTSPP